MRTTSVVLLGLIIGGLACCAELSDKTVATLQDAAASAGSQLELTINGGCGGTYYEGDKVVLSVTSPIRGYLYLFDFQADGNTVMMLFPNRRLWGNLPLTVEASAGTALPPPSGPKLAVSFPFGREAVFALVVPEEQVNTVAQFDAYNPQSDGVRTGSEAIASLLFSLVMSLEGNGQDCAAGVCLFTCVEKLAETPDKPLSVLLDEAVAAASSPLQLTVNDGCGKAYGQGQRLTFSVTSPVDGYLYLFYFPAAGDQQLDLTYMLFPSLLWWGSFPLTVEANTKVALSREPETRALLLGPRTVTVSLFSVGEPFGEELLLALVVPEEQMDLVNKWYAYDRGTKSGGVRQTKSYVGVSQRKEAAALLSLVMSLAQRGVKCAAGVCSFFATKVTAAPSSPGTKTGSESGP